MITIFNRRELFVTVSLEKQMEIRQRLSDAGIDYVLKTKNLEAGGQFGHLGIHPSVNLEYRFYVRKEDEDRARHVIGR